MSFKLEHETAQKNEVYVSNPLNAYLLIKRLTADMELMIHSTYDLAEGEDY